MSQSDIQVIVILILIKKYPPLCENFYIRISTFVINFIISLEYSK